MKYFFSCILIYFFLINSSIVFAKNIVFGTIYEKIVSGSTQEELRPLSGVIVELWDEDRLSRDELMACGKTDLNGKFKIKYRKCNMDRDYYISNSWRPDIYVRVRKDGKLKYSGQDKRKVDHICRQDLEVKVIIDPNAWILVPEGKKCGSGSAGGNTGGSIGKKQRCPSGTACSEPLINGWCKAQCLAF